MSSYISAALLIRSIKLDLELDDEAVLCDGEAGASVDPETLAVAEVSVLASLIGPGWLLLSLFWASMARVPGETDDDGDVSGEVSGGVSMTSRCDVTMSISPTRVEPSLKRTRFLWARRQFCFNSSRMASMAEHILRAGPSLIDMADMR